MNSERVIAPCAKFREVLRWSARGLDQHQIARNCSIVQSTVHKHLKVAEAAQVGWPLPGT